MNKHHLREFDNKYYYSLKAKSLKEKGLELWLTFDKISQTGSVKLFYPLFNFEKNQFAYNISTGMIRKVVPFLEFAINNHNSEHSLEKAKALFSSVLEGNNQFLKERHIIF